MYRVGFEFALTVASFVAGCIYKNYVYGAIANQYLKAKAEYDKLVTDLKAKL